VDPRRLLIFEAVVRAGSFSAASIQLHLSQPSVSRQVAALESECRQALLLRTRKGLRLTPAGVAVLERSQAIRAELAALDVALGAFANHEAGEVRILTFPTAAAALVAPAMGRLRNAHPAIRFNIRESPRRVSLAMLRDGEADLALVFDTPDDRADTHGLATQLLLEERFLAALPRSHPLAAQPTVSLRRLRDEGWIVGTAADRPGAIERACLSAGFTPRIVAALDDQPAIQALVASGLGVTLIPQLAAARPRPDIVLRPIRPAGIIRRISVVTLDVTPRAASIVALIDELAFVAETTRGS
jgi:DNA-binding transcriptional LysR family regulator